MKMKDIIAGEQCITKNVFNSLKERKEKNYYNAIIIKSIFNTYGLNFNAKEIMDLVQKTMPPNLFQTNREGTINTNNLILRLVRIKEYLTSFHLKKNSLVHNGGDEYVTNHSIKVDYNLMIETDNEVNVIKFKNKKCDLSKSGRSIYTKISENMELFLLQLAGETKFPNKNCKATIIYLRHPDDDRDSLIPMIEYAAKTAKAVVTCEFFDDKKIEMMGRLENIINKTPINQCKNCKDCSYNNLCNYNKKNIPLVSVKSSAKANNNVSFTYAQQELIEAESGVYRVLAGAGSGKTTCIANRICKLIEKGENINNMLLITYTNKGAREMYEKVEYWLKRNKVDANVKNLSIFTFNSFGYELLKKEYTRFGYTEEPKLLDDSESMALIKTILDDNPEIPGYNYAFPLLDMYNAKGVVLVLKEYFNLIKRTNSVYPEEVEMYLNVNIDIAKQILGLYNIYKKHMFDNNFIDYSDQINYCYEILKQPELLKKYGYGHVIVDEFQDSDMLQINILGLLINYPYFKSLMVVGDDSQAIFKFRGATSKNIIEFHNTFPNTQDIELLENFRSTKEICNLANKINDINVEKVPKQLIAVKSGDKPQLAHTLKVKDFIEQLIDSIKYNNYEYKNIAIISKNRKELYEMQNLLNSYSIPSVLSVNQELIKVPSVCNLINFAKFLLDNENSLYFAEYLEVYDFDTFKSIPQEDLCSYVELQMQNFLDELNSYSTEIDKLNFIYSKFKTIAKEDKAVETLLELLNAKNFTTINHMAKFLIEMELYKSSQVVEPIEEPVNAITLTTGHSSKGREWDVVYVYLDNFKYPKQDDYMGLRNNPDIEEERRLLFVSITRAKNNLYLYGNSYSSIYTEIAEALNESN